MSVSVCYYSIPELTCSQLAFNVQVKIVKNANGLAFDYFYISPAPKQTHRMAAHCKYTSPFRGGQFTLTAEIFELWPELFSLFSYIKAFNAELLLGVKNKVGVDIVPEARSLQLYQNEVARACEGGTAAAMACHMRSCAVTVLVDAVKSHDDIKKSSCSPDVKHVNKEHRIPLPACLSDIPGFFESKIFKYVPSLNDHHSPYAGGRGGGGPGCFVWGMVDHPYYLTVLRRGHYAPAAVNRLNHALRDWIARLAAAGAIEGPHDRLLEQVMVDMAGSDYTEL